MIQNEKMRLFITSINLLIMSEQLKIAKIIPLKKLEKQDYIMVKVYYFIFLMATLTKMLKSIIAQILVFLINKIFFFLQPL